MVDDLRLELHNKSVDVKNKIKELNNILSNLYNNQKRNFSKNIYDIKRTAEKVSSAVKHLNNLDLTVDESKASDKDFETKIREAHKGALKNILLLEDIYKEKLRKKVSVTGSVEIVKYKKNLDSLRLAYEDLKRMNLSFDNKLGEWEKYNE